jgi:G:T/U-mismatch repair DNA glycosylase
VVPNDFAGFFAAHRELRFVCFNGQAAAELCRRQVLPGLPVGFQALRYETLPSTSPAHAAMPFEAKLKRWEVVRREASR